MNLLKLARNATLIGMIGSILQFSFILKQEFYNLFYDIEGLIGGYLHSNPLSFILNVIGQFIYLFSVLAVVVFFVMMLMYYNKKLAAHKNH